MPNSQSLPRVLSALFLVACGGAADTTTQVPTAPSPTTTNDATEVAAPTGDPFKVEGILREEQLPLLKGPQPTVPDVALETKPKGVPAPPASCDAYAKRASKEKVSCADQPQALAALDAAMGKADPNVRDEALSALESCKPFEPGVIRGIRVELAPLECGDALAEPILMAKPAGMSGAVQHALLGHTVAARLTRAVRNPPVMKGPFTKKRVEEFLKSDLAGWFKEQSTALDALSAQAKDLSSYGKGVVAISAGWGYLRFVEAAREAPVPKEFTTDRDLGNEYYSSLDMVLEPFKERGRDASLVGLGHMARAGVIIDERTDRTRTLLSKMYGGRRVDSLDVLALLPLAEPPADKLEARIAARVPTYFAGLVLDAKLSTDAGVMRALARRGMPLQFRSALKENEASISDEVRLSYARARLEMARRYWRAVDVDQAIALYAKVPAEKLREPDRLGFALALALRNGPEDVSMLMRSNDAMGKKFADVAALDVVAKDPAAKSSKGIAGFDAAVLRQIAVPHDAPETYWDALAARYKDAVANLGDGKLKDEAQRRADAAVATAKVRKGP